MIVDLTSVVGAFGDVGDRAQDRARSVKLVNVVFDGLMQALADGLPRPHVRIWSDTTVGEGIMYRAISTEIPRMVTFHVDAEHHPADLETEVAQLVARFKPDTLCVPLSWHELRVAEDASRRRLRALYARLLEVGRHWETDIAWDIRSTSTPPVDNITDTLKIMEWLQDRGLDPNAWALDLPVYDRFAMMLVARAHIDGNSEIQVMFRSEGHRVEPQADLERVTERLATIDTSTQMLIGASYFSSELKRFVDGEADASEVTELIALRLAEVSAWADRELATTH